MVMAGFNRRSEPLELLTEEQIETLHWATLEVLEETGVVFDHPRALKLFADNGCDVDFDQKRVRIPGYLVEECIRKCPSSFSVRARDPRSDLRIGGNVVYFLSFCGLKTVDLSSWKPRTATLEDANNAARVLDALENIHLQDYGPYFELEGVPPAMVIPTSFAIRISNSTKITYSGFKWNSEIFNIEMAQVAGTQVLGSIMDAAPLTYQREAIEAAFRFIEAGWPMKVNSSGTFGATHPVTTAGSMVVTNATEMAAIVLIQLIKPGTGVTVLHFSFPMDMRSGQLAFGDVQSCLHGVAFNQIWRRYGLPTFDSTAISSSKMMDYQCGYEKAIGTLLYCLAGGNIVQGAGGVYGEITYHPVMAVIDNDMYGMIGRFVQGVDVTEDTLALDLIQQVGPMPGYYLDTEHTRRWWKKEQFMPKVADRLPYPEWLEKGGQSAVENAKERVKHILDAHSPTLLSEEQAKEISKILQTAKKHYEEKGLA